MVARVKKNDTVFVLWGRDKGKTGSVIQVKPKKKTQPEIDAGYNTKYDVYVSANQTADQPEEGQPAI